VVPISGIFPICFRCFLHANTTNKNSMKYRSFAKPFLCNIQNLEACNLRDRNSRLQNLCIYPIFFKTVVITSKLIFFQISGIFLTFIRCFLPAYTTNKKSLKYRSFNKPFFAIFKVSRPAAFETETRKNGSRDFIAEEGC